MIEIERIDQSNLLERLPVVAPHLRLGLGTPDADDMVPEVARCLASGVMHAWGVHNGNVCVAALATVKMLINGRHVMTVHSLHGRGIFQWRHTLVRSLLRHAARENCEALMFEGRPAHDRLWRGYGVKKIGDAEGLTHYEIPVRK